MLGALLALTFLATPAPLDMPRAQAFLVRENDVSRLEDRYDRLDLWVARESLGRWIDDDLRVFSLYRLDTCVPAVEAEAVDTRVAFEDACVVLEKKDIRHLRQAVETLSPVGLADKGRPPRQLPRGFKDVDYWQAATNLSTIVCAFLPERADHWFLGVWELVEGDDLQARTEEFEERFLRGDWKTHAFAGIATASGPNGRAKDEAPSERELLRRDARHSVTNYANWHCTDSREFSVLDNLTRARDFVTALTNELPVLRQKYAETIPSPLDGSNVLCVARLYDTREEYLEAAGPDMAWTAAYWCPQRRELVAHMPDGGAAQLMRTCRHEAFHQYLSYAASMISVSPWLNEGYAQYFEDTDARQWGEGLVFTPDDIERLAAMLPAVLGMDYDLFYAGTDDERRLKYRLAWSIAVFLEVGAPKVRFAPFKDIKQSYMRALLESRDMRQATSAAFGTDDRLKLFVAEWKRFWIDM